MRSEIRDQGSGIRGQGSGFRVQGFRVRSSGFGVLRFRGWGLQELLERAGFGGGRHAKLRTKHASGYESHDCLLILLRECKVTSMENPRTPL
ncbi:hypothetical protein T484DRAFT_2521952 [Baffinella frigidus]|nr:hypothetical protein T484DRAFT_2521952 [Cryptophyta sp. CCMP2293]